MRPISWLLTFLFSFNAAYAAGVGLTLQGRILKSDGTPVLSSNVQFKIQIRSSGTEDCLLFEESQLLDMTGSSGLFVLTVGSGTRVASALDGGYSIDRIFANRGTLDFSATSPSACAIGSSYTPSVADNRRLLYSFNDGVGGWQVIPPTNISWVPLALESLQVGGFRSSQILRVLDAAGNPQTAPTLLPTDVAELVALLSGTSTRYLQPSSTATFSSTITFSNAPQFSGTPSVGSDLTNKTYVDSSISTAVSSVLPNVGTAGTYYKVSTDAKGRVTSGASSLMAADIPSLDASKVTTGTFGGAVGINTMGNIYSSGIVTGGTVSATNLRIYSGSNYLQVSAGSMSGNLNWILPNTNGSAGQLLKTDGAGNLSWVAASSGSVTGVTATPPLAAGTGATPNITISQATTSTDGYLSSTDFNTFNSKLGTTTTHAGDVSGVYNAMSVDKLKGAALSITSLTSGNFLRYNGSNWVNTNLVNADITTGLGYAPLNKAGDTMTGLIVLSADPSANLGSATKQYVDSSTTAAAANYIRKDGTVAFTGTQSMGSNKLTFVTDPTSAQDAATKSYADTKILGKGGTAPAAGQDGQVLRWNNGNATWEYYTASAVLGYTPVNIVGDTMTGALIHPAGTAAAPSVGVGATTLGLFNGGTNILGFSTAGTERMRITNAGNVGIGTTAPSTALDVVGALQTTGDITIPNGSASAAAPRTLGVYATSSGPYSRFAFESNNAAGIQGGWAQKFQIYSWHGIELSGGQNVVGPSFASGGGSSDTNVLVINRGNSTGATLAVQGGASQSSNLQEWRNSSGTSLSVVNSSGNVGIGVLTPTSKLQIDSNMVPNTNGDVFHALSNLNIQPTAVATGIRANFYATTTVPGTNTQPIDDIRGLFAYSTAAGSGTIGAIYGGRFYSEYNGSVTATSVVGALNGAGAGAGTVVGTSTNLIGTHSIVAAYGGNVTAMTGVFVETNQFSGTVTNRYGIFLKTPFGTATSSDFGIFQQGTQKNYFAGNVGIGTSSPSEKLQVQGNIRASGQLSTGSQVISAGTTALDFNNGNSISTDYNCAANLAFANLRDGGTYTLVTTDVGTTQCSFSTATTGTDATTVTYRFKPANAARTVSTHSVYTLMRVGTVVYVSWGSGF